MAPVAIESSMAAAASLATPQARPSPTAIRMPLPAGSVGQEMAGTEFPAE